MRNQLFFPADILFLRAMKTVIYLFCTVLLLASCQNKATKQKTGSGEPVAAGALVAADSMPLNDLNHFYFTVKVFANKNTAGYGDYDVEASVGPSLAEGQFTMPKGGKDFRPVIKKATDGTTYIIGFHAADDTAFYEYYEVSAISGGQISMKYLKGYSFE